MTAKPFHGIESVKPPFTTANPPFNDWSDWKEPAKASRLALGRLPAGTLNKTEQAYSAHLGLLMAAGEVVWFKFEGVKLRLADNTFYTPDFAVMASDGVIEMHEVKGFWTDDARVKIKVAAALFPFRFKAMKARSKAKGGGWEVEHFGEAA